MFPLAKYIYKNDSGLYCDDGLIMLRNVNKQKMDRMKKNIIKIFKDVTFKIEIQTNLKIVDFLDVTFNLENGTYRPYKKPNDSLLYINTSSNHPPQVIKQLPTSINKRLNKNSSCKQVFEESKLEYESALKNCGYNHVKLTFNKEEHQPLKRTRHRNVIWCNPPFSRNVTIEMPFGVTHHSAEMSPPM